MRKVNRIPLAELEARFYIGDGRLCSRRTGKPVCANVTIRGNTYRTYHVLWRLQHRSDIPDNLFLDHKNRDPGVDTTSNLRLASRSQNASNSDPRSGRKFKGLRRWGNKWHAQIRVNGIKSHLGSYDNEEEAARAYDRAARAAFGEFARLNFE